MPEGDALDWTQIDTVFLDMDGTLLDQRFDNWFWQEHVPIHYAQARGLSELAASAALAPMFHAVKGTMQWYCIDYWSEALDLDIAALKRTELGRIAFLPGAESFLDKLEASGKRRVLVTNAHPVTLAIKNQQVRLAQRCLLFDPSVRSAQGRSDVLAAVARHRIVRARAHPVRR
jgi:5'-nucleotidase